MWRWVALAPLAGCALGTAPDDDPADDGPSAPPPGCVTGDIALTPGTGADGYQPLVDGDPVEMVHGPQGGWHVETAGLVENSEPDVAITPSIVAEAAGIDVTGVLQPDYKALVGYDEGACAGTFYGTRAYLDYDRDTGPSGLPFVCSLAGLTATFSVRVEDIVSGRDIVREVEVVLDLDPTDVPNCP